MKSLIIAISGLLAFGPCLSANGSNEAKSEQERLQNAGKVMQEILHVPNNIPQDLLDKACCVVVMPSVLKAALVVGGSYGRGTMVCRTGQDFSGPWGAPAMYALEGGSVGIQIGGEPLTSYLCLEVRPEWRPAACNEAGERSVLAEKGENHA
jgi:lipid-binding SYLF domain-containing protein